MRKGRYKKRRYKCEECGRIRFFTCNHFIASAAQIAILNGWQAWKDKPLLCAVCNPETVKP